MVFPLFVNSFNKPWIKRHFIHKESGPELPEGYAPLDFVGLWTTMRHWIDFDDLDVEKGYVIEFDYAGYMQRSKWCTLVCDNINKANFRFGYNSEGRAPQAQVYTLSKITGTSTTTNVHYSSSFSDALDRARCIYTVAISDYCYTEVTDSAGIKFVTYKSLYSSFVPEGATLGKLRILSNAGDYCYGNLYGVKIYKNGALIKDLIPCKNIALSQQTHMCGRLYDTISKTIYRNSYPDNEFYDYSQF